MRRIAIIALTAACSSPHASELSYKPVNPNFGGSPLNGSHLIANAQAQNDFKAPSSGSSFSQRSALDRFTSSLESRLLSQLLADVGNGNTGSLTTDDFILNIVDDAGTLKLSITDRNTNEVTEIEVNGLIPD